MSDPVNHPSHYNQGSVECIDAIRSALGDAFPDYCVGNSIKYTYRWRHKGGVEDLRKAIVYLQWAVDAMELNTSKTSNSCEPREKKYRNVTDGDIGEVVCVSDDGVHWNPGYVLNRIDKKLPHPFYCDGEPFTYARIEVVDPAEPANNPKTLESCEPEKQYRDVTEADAGKMIEVRDYDDAVWCTRKLIAIRDSDKRRYVAQNEEDCLAKWKFARIEVTEPSEKQYRYELTVADIGKKVEVRDEDSQEWVVRELVTLYGKTAVCKTTFGNQKVWKQARIEVVE